MQLQLIRNATLRLYYVGHWFLIDPYLAPRHSLPSFTGASPNPTVDLPCSPQEVIAGIETVIVSHLHTDHFDSVAQDILPKDIPLFCQPGDETRIATKCFQHITPISERIVHKDVTLTRTEGQHGSGAVLNDMGPVSGFVFEAEGEPTIYWAGDTIWYEPVANAIQQVQPDIIITHSCGAYWKGQGPIVMDAQQTLAVCRAAMDSIIIATHMESLDHATVSRADLRAAAEQTGISDTQLRIPADGEIIAGL